MSAATLPLVPLLTAAQILARLITVDGTGSGLDADTVDGIHASAFVQIAGTQTITGDKTFSGAVSVIDGSFSIKGSSDATKVARFEVDGLTTGTTRVFTLPNADVVVAGSAAAMTSGRVPYVTTGGLLTDGATLTYDSAVANLSIGDGTNGTNPQINVLGAAGTNRDWIWKSGTLRRWMLRVTSTAESGSAAGSDFALKAFNDAGSAIDDPISITRASGGAIALARPVSMASTLTVATLTSGRIPFASTSGLLTDSASLTWDGTSLTTTTTASNGIVISRTSAYASNGGASMAIKADDGTTAMGSGHRLGSFSFQGRRDATTIGTAVIVNGYATEAWSTTAMGSKLTIETTPNLSTTRVVALTIDQDQSATFAGRVAIATTLGSLAMLNVGGSTLTGTVQQGVRGDITGTTAATSGIYGVAGVARTTASAFTCGLVVGGYFAVSTLGAGSTITRGVGAMAEVGLGTNTAGVLIVANAGTPAFTGTWAIRSESTLSSALAGSLLVGTATDDGVNKLQVAGSVALAASQPFITLTCAATGGQGVRFLTGAGTKTNWFIGGQFNIDGGFEITPSTAAGGSNFTTPVVSVVTTGATLTVTNSGTTDRPNVLQIGHNTSGTPASGFGSTLRFVAQTTTLASQDLAMVESLWVSPTHASRTGRVAYSVFDSTGSRECFRMEANGSAAAIGFLGASAAARVTFAAWTGTATRTAIATSTATATQCAEAIKALVDDLRTFGIYG